MASIEGLKEQLRDLLIVNHGSFNMIDHPQVMIDARAAGLDPGALSQFAQQIHASINWEPFRLIDASLALIIQREILTLEEAELMLQSVKDKLTYKQTSSYIISEIRRKGFEPREKNHLDPDSFMNRWMTDNAWEQNRLLVEWLDEKAGSLEKIGEISFRKKEQAQYYLRKSQYLVGLVTILTKSATKAHEFELLIDGEADTEKRYLRLIYKLNKSLPFRFRGGMYIGIAPLMEAACESYESFLALSDLYISEHLTIWLEAIEPQMAAQQPKEKTYFRFLQFVYLNNPGYPYFLSRYKIADPRLLTGLALENREVWPLIGDHIKEGYFEAWLRSIGKDAVIENFRNNQPSLTHPGLYQDQELPLATVQAFLLSVDPEMERPGFELDKSEIILTGIEGKDIITVPVRIIMKNSGYIKVTVVFDENIDGISVNQNAYIFDSFDADNLVHTMLLSVDTLKLVKDHTYKINLSVDSVYESISIPVYIKAIFPQRAYSIKLVQYAAIFGVVFAGFRYMMGVVLNYDYWLPEGPFLARESPFIFFVLFILFISGNFFALKWIRRAEKI